MTKNYFINRMIEMGVSSKLTKDASFAAKNICRWFPYLGNSFDIICIILNQIQ